MYITIYIYIYIYTSQYCSKCAACVRAHERIRVLQAQTKCFRVVHGEQLQLCSLITMMTPSCISSCQIQLQLNTYIKESHGYDTSVRGRASGCQLSSLNHMTCRCMGLSKIKVMNETSRDMAPHLPMLHSHQVPPSPPPTASAETK